MTVKPLRTVWVAIDGDDIGRQIERLVAADDVNGVRAFSAAVSERIRELLQFVKDHQGQVLLCAGDSLLCELPDHIAIQLCQISTNTKDGLSFSGGIGNTIALAMLSLKFAKAKGKRQFVSWDEVARDFSDHVITGE